MKTKSGKKFSVALVWRTAPGRGSVEVTNGRLAGMRSGARRIAAGKRGFSLPGAGPSRLEIELADTMVGLGAHATLVGINTPAASFSFFARDVDKQRPIWIPESGVAVTTASDPRDYEAIVASIRNMGLVSRSQQYRHEPEETYAAACARNRNLMCPTWLGLSRDMRVFRVGYNPLAGYLGFVEPYYHANSRPGDESPTLSLNFGMGPGSSCRVKIVRWLEEKSLPILHARQEEDDVTYHLTAFATLETQPISSAVLRGSDWRSVYPNSAGHMLSPEELARIQPLVDHEMYGREEETVCCVRVEAVNSARVPRYAWFKTIFGHAWRAWPSMRNPFDGQTGFSYMKDSSSQVCAVSLLNGAPMPQEEMAILLPPGEKAVFDLIIPHQPLPAARARKLARLDVARHLDACRAFWKAKSNAGARIRVPEPAVDERIRAGLLHCDLVAYGLEPKGNVLATIGTYSPIGSESAPIIQFFDSMGHHKLAERALQFFLDRQRDDGFIQNFSGYQLETGPVLWTMGEHFRYTHDTRWVRRVKPNILKACDYLLNWRARNQRPELRGKGYGLLDGKVADPQDFFHSFMLNGVSYIGLQRAAEMLAEVDPHASRRLAREAAAFRRDIRTAFNESVARSPVVPLGDGSWVSTAPPWTEYRGPVSLYAEGGNWFTHGAFGARDSIIGSLYLVIGEVLDAREPAVSAMLRWHQELYTVENAGLTQPYYVRHDIAHLRRGETKEFLKTYYNQFSALQDRETYTFWEHYYHASQHKTHEEGWFLMQTRWMLWLEEDDGIAFLRGIPRRWLADGQEIELDGVATHFGPASLLVRSEPGRGQIVADVRFRKGRGPAFVSLRLPHPEGLRPQRVSGGEYDAATETLTVRPFKGSARIVLEFDLH